MEKDLFASHQIWGALKDVESALTQIDELGDAVISSELDEVRQVRAYAVALSEADQLFLIGVPLLDELNAAWSQVGTSLNNYLQNPAGHKSHLDNATGPYLDAVRSSLSRFPRADEAGAKKAAATRAASAYLSQLDESRELLSAQIQALKSDRNQMIERHKVELEEQTIVVENLRSQISALTSRIGEDETRISTALTESNEAFIKAQSERQERFGKWLEQQEERFDEEARPQYEGIMAAANRADEALKEVEELRTSVVNMSNLASGDILGDEYKKSARWDRVAGYIGYGVGILAGAMGIWILLFAFGDAQAGLEWPQVALKLGLTTGIGGVAAVAFRFGGQSLSRATAFKRQELELRALTPFLQGVQGSDEAKLTFVRQAFGRAWVPEQKADQSSDSAPNAELVKLVQAAVEAIARTSK